MCRRMITMRPTFKSNSLTTMKKTLLRFVILVLLVFAPASEALAQSRVWISNPTNFRITYKLLFSRSSQNFSIAPGLRNEHASREYPATFLVDVNVNLRGYPQVKRFRLSPNRTYYFQLSGTQLHLLKQPLHQHHGHHRGHAAAPVTAKVLVYALGGPQPVYHSSIILYNTSDPYINSREWSFWPTGRAVIGNIGYMSGGNVRMGRPRGCGNPIRTFDLTTRHNAQTAAAIYNDVRNRWNQRPYRALDSNCNHFVNDVMNALGAGRHPVQYQNSWGTGVPLTHIQSAFQNNYGVTCNHPGHHHGHTNHGHGTHLNQPRNVKSEILNRVLRRIGL